MTWIKYILVPVILMLAIVSFVPAVTAEVALLEGKDQAVGPDAEVTYRFYVRNNDRWAETVRISVSTEYDYEISSNNFQLNYREDREVAVTVFSPDEVEERIEDTVIIMFLEVSIVDTDTTGYTFLLVVLPPEEIPDHDNDGIPDWEDEDYYDDYDDGYYDDDPIFEEGFDYLKNLFIQVYLLAVMVTIIGFLVGVWLIRSKFLEDFDEALWDVELRPHIKSIFQGGFAHPKMKNVWTIRNIWGSIGGIAVFWFSFLIMELMFFRGFPIVSLVCGTMLVFLLIWAPLQASFYYQNYRFILKKDRIVVHSGIVTRWKTVVPYVRITDVDTISWFLDRLFGLTTIRINTAGSSSPEAYIKGIKNPEPIIQHIMKRARIARESKGPQ